MEIYIRPCTDKMVDSVYRRGGNARNFPKAIAPYIVLSGPTLMTAALVACYAPAIIAIPVCLVASVVLAKFSWTILAVRKTIAAKESLKELCFTTSIRNLIGLHASDGRLEKFINQLPRTEVEALKQELLAWISIIAQHQDAEQIIARKVFSSLMGGADHLMAAFLSAVGAHCALVSSLSRLKDEDGVTLLMRAAWYGNKGSYKALVQLLLSAGANPTEKDRRGSTAFHHAISSGNAEGVERLLAADPDHACIGELLGAAALCAHPLHGLKCVKKLLSMGVNSNSQYEGQSIVSCAVLGSRVEVLKALLDAGIHPNVKDSKDGMTPLMHAAEAQNFEKVQLLLKAGARPTGRDRQGKTALIYAVQHSVRPSKDIRVTQALLAAGASLKRRDRASKSALMYAVGDLETTRILLAAGTSLTDRDRNDQTALMWAIQSGPPEVIAELCNAALSQGHGGFLDDQTRDGMTTLTMAIKRDHTQIVSILLESGNMVHIAHQKPIRYALKQGSWKSALLLLLRGASRIIDEEEEGQTVLDDLEEAALDWDTRNEMLEILMSLRDMERHGTNISQYLVQIMKERHIHDLFDLKYHLLLLCPSLPPATSRRI